MKSLKDQKKIKTTHKTSPRSDIRSNNDIHIHSIERDLRVIMNKVYSGESELPNPLENFYRETNQTSIHDRPRHTRLGL